MPVTRPLITTAIKRMGPAEVFVGNPMVLDGMTSLGLLEGERRGEIEWSENPLTLPEHSGEVPHDKIVAVSSARVVLNLILNASGAAVWPKISALGSAGGGNSAHIKPATTSVLLIPHSELGKSLTYSVAQSRWERTNDDNTVTTDATATPAHALWLWKANVRHGNIPYGFENGGKSLVEVTFEAWFDDTKPEGAKVYYIGNPRTHTTPIPVIL